MIAPSDQTAGPAMTIGQIEKCCSNFEAENSKLQEMIADYERDLEAINSKHVTALKRQASVVARVEAVGISAVESGAGAGLFIKPRTLVIHGVKIGLVNSVGRVVYDDDDTTVKLIRKFHKEDADLYIHKEESPNKDAIKTLSADDQHKIGCRIEGAGYSPIFKSVDSDMERMIKKMMEKLVAAIVSNE